MNEPFQSAGESTLEDRRWALLAYLFTPVVPLMLFLVENVRDRPFVRPHLYQALGLGVILLALLILVPFTACLTTPLFLGLYGAVIYWGIRAYNGETFEIPWLTGYMRQQGWLQ